MIDFATALELWLLPGRIAAMSIGEELFQAIQDEIKPGDRTLEFGSGVSTYAFGPESCHTAIEQNANQAKATFAIWSPLGPDGWYKVRLHGKYRVILVDGPAGGNRFEGFDQIVQCSDDDTVIFIDDTHRAKERRLAKVLGEYLERRVVISKPDEFGRTFARIG